jgi:hypothetical protein
MIQPGANIATFRARPPWRSGCQLVSVQSPLIGTNGAALTGNLRVPIATPASRFVVGAVSFTPTVAAAAATYTVQVGKRTAAGVDVPLSTAQSMLAAGITAAGGLNRQLLFTALATLTDAQRSFEVGDMLYLDFVVTTLTVQPTLQIAAELYIKS